MPRLNKRTLDALKPKADRFFVWDDKLSGFGVRCYPTGRIVFLTQVRVGRAQRRVTIGDYGPFTAEQARDRANKIIAGARDGVDPQAAKREARQAKTVAELCDAYMEAARAGLVTTRFHRPKSPATVAIDEGRIARHIKPLIGSLPAAKLSTAAVQRMSDAIAQGKTAGTFKGKTRGMAVVTGGTGTATRVVELLGGIWTWGRKRGHVSGASPTTDVDRVRGAAKNRVLSPAELKALADACDGRAGVAVRLIALTGWRREEVEGLRWDEIDGQTARLIDTKDKSRPVSMRPVGQAALDVLATIPRYADWVFPNRNATGPADLKSEISEIFNGVGLTRKDEKSQALRRTFASAAADMGYSDATIDVLIGHAPRGITERHYVRRSDPVLIAAADRVAAAIAARMRGQAADVVPLRRGGGAEAW
jgi:integrase